MLDGGWVDESERQQQLVEGLRAASWRVDAGTAAFVAVGGEIEALFGYPRTLWLEGDRWLDHVHPEDRDAVQTWLRLDAADAPSQFAFRIQHADGRWVSVQARSLSDSDDHALRSGFFFDVSEYQRQTALLGRLNRALRTANACNAALLQADSEQELLDEICRIAVQTGGYRMAWVGEAVRDDAKRVRSRARFGDDNGYLDDLDIRWNDSRLGQGPTGRAIRSGRVVVLDDIETDPIMAPWRAAALNRGFRSSIALPLRDRGQVFGALSIYAGESHSFDDDAVDLLERLADNLGYGLTALRDRAQRQRSERYLEALYACSPDMVLLYGEDGRLLDVNGNALRGLGLARDELMATFPARLLGEGVSLRDVLRRIRRAREGEDQDFELPLRRANGEVFPAEIRLRRLATYQEQDEPRVLAMVRDITEQKAAISRSTLLSMALEQTADAVSIADPAGRIEYVNPAFERITGYSRAEAVGKPQSLVKSGRHDKAFYNRLWATLGQGRTFREVFVNRRKNGELFYEEKTITPVRDEQNRIEHFVATGKDITERMATEERLRYLAHHDVLTGLPNRTLFMDRLEHALAQRPKDQGVVALMFVDLDRFKLINDSLGHDAGDRLLQVVSRRLRACVRQGDTIARLGGDEFGIILQGLEDGQRAADVARKLIVELTRPIVEKDAELFVTLSIGISLAPFDGHDAQALLKHADVAMYRAKERGRDTFQFYSADMSERATERLNLETQLRYAHERGEFRLCYQPQIRLSDRQVVGVEALLRWDHPTLGVMEPAAFVPVLEESGLIVPVGEWVLFQACMEMQALKEEAPHAGLSVNLSSRQFMVSDMASLVERALAHSGLNPRRLTVEITESLILRDDTQTLRALTGISDMGPSIAIDDFGTGYSALSYLKRFPIDTLKIDRSFVRDIATDPDDAAIVEAVIAMSGSLDLLVVAEGVAEQVQLEFLEKLGCAVAQGYLFGPPAGLREALKIPS